eukprot:TRINITY_DN5745_c0_g4_i1.p1 TRINITY_DN5745_c0_g4~~TRINITY_DN5745_c0_g4_i1.p1  ORF type:complete len:1185 (-),score=260.66 TRINITY_DN5745_c0_g4_i1:200-3754(-)
MAAKKEEVGDRYEGYTVNVSWLIWRILFEQRLFRALSGFALVVVAAACISTGLHVLRPVDELARVDRFLHDHFEMESMAAVADATGVYDAMTQFGLAAAGLRAVSPQLWCESRFHTNTWDKALETPVAGCESPRLQAMGVSGRPTWLAWQAGQASSGSGGGAILAAPGCADNVTALRVATNDGSATCSVRSGVCDFSHSAQHCRVSCGYCGPFKYEPVGKFTARQIVPTQVLAVQKRRKRSACAGFAANVNRVGVVTGAKSVPRGHAVDAAIASVDSSHVALQCADPDGTAGQAPKPLCGLDAKCAADGFVDSTTSAADADAPSYLVTLGADPSAVVQRLSSLGWLDSLTDTLALEALVYVEELRIYSHLVLEFQFDSAGGVRAVPSVRSHKDPSDYGLLAALFMVPWFLAFVAVMAGELKPSDQKEYMVVSDGSRTSRAAGGISLRAVKSVDGASEGRLRWGARVLGVETGDGWLRVGRRLLLPMAKDGGRVFCVADPRTARPFSRILEPYTLSLLLVGIIALFASYTVQPWLQESFSGVLRSTIDGSSRAELAQALEIAGREVDALHTWGAAVRTVGYFVLLALALQSLLYLGVHPRLHQIGEALLRCCGEALHTSFAIAALFLLIAGAATMAFGGSGDELPDATFSAACSTQLRWLLGEPFFLGAKATSDPLAPGGRGLALWKFYALLFFFLASWGVLDVLAAMLLDAVYTCSDSRSDGKATALEVDGSRTSWARGLPYDILDCLRSQLRLGPRSRAKLLSGLRALPSKMRALPSLREATAEHARRRRWDALGASPGAEAAAISDLREAMPDGLASDVLDSVLSMYHAKSKGQLLTAPPEGSSDEAQPQAEGEELSFADIVHLDKRTIIDLRRRSESRAVALLQWAQGALEGQTAWEQFAPAMACSIVQEVLAAVIDGQEDAALLDSFSEPVDRFFAKVALVPHNVLGTRSAAKGTEEVVGPEPDANTTVVDLANLLYVQGTGPRGAGGASAAVYKWLGFGNQESFSEEVRTALQAELDVKFVHYGSRHVIHIVGPDLRSVLYKGGKRSAVIRALSRVYSSILSAFAESGRDRLRLPPVSGGIFAGEYGNGMAEITKEAMMGGFKMLEAELQEKVLDALEIDLCVPADNEYNLYLELMPPRAKPAKPYVNYVIQDYVPTEVPEAVDLQNDDVFSDASSASC